MIRVVMADDEPNLRLLVRATIESDECAVVEAADGDEAWSLLGQVRPTVALLDVQMPGRTGLDLARAMRADRLLKDIKIILLTAKAQATDVAAGLEAGADLYLTKPFSPLQLLTVLEQVTDGAIRRPAHR